MILNQLQKLLCPDFLVEVDETTGKSVAITTMSYPNGDSINLYYDRIGESLVVTDGGQTVDFLHQQKVKLTNERREMIKRMCIASDASFVAPELRREFLLPEIGAASLALCETITSVAAIYYHAPSQSRSSLPVAVNRLLRDRVLPVRGVEFEWIDRRHDHEGAFPVDVHVNGVGNPRHIFTVTSPRKGLMVTAVVHFLRSHGIVVPTLTIVDKEAQLGSLDVNRLQLASEEIRFGLEGNEGEVVEFALSQT